MNYLCFDIGGTFIKYATFNELGEQLTPTQKIATHITQDDNGILEQVLTTIQAIQATESLDGVAIATAGVVDSQKGSLRYAGYTIPNYTGTPLKEAVETQTGLACTVENDVNAACLGEIWKGFGSDKTPKSVVCLTIGTGVGGAIAIDGQLYHGYTDMAGEIGYLPINGNYFQDLASTTALLKFAHEATGQEMTGETFFETLKQQSNPDIERVFETFINHLATGLMTIHYLLNPEYIVIGGGILAQEAIIMPKLKAQLKQIAVDERFLTANIIPATLGNNAGMLGALYAHLNTSR